MRLYEEEEEEERDDNPIVEHPLTILSVIQVKTAAHMPTHIPNPAHIIALTLSRK